MDVEPVLKLPRCNVIVSPHLKDVNKNDDHVVKREVVATLGREV